MRNIEKQISHHEKCIAVLEAIRTINDRILGNSAYIDKWFKMDFVNMSEHYKKRKDIDEKIKARLENYYIKLIEKL